MSTETTAPATKHAAAAFRSPLIIAIAAAIAVVLLTALLVHLTPVVQSDQASKRAAFEKVAVMSSDELEGKTVPELNGYRKDILDAANYGFGLFGNITGYSADFQTHELDQVNALIMKKADR